MKSKSNDIAVDTERGDERILRGIRWTYGTSKHNTIDPPIRKMDLPHKQT